MRAKSRRLVAPVLRRRLLSRIAAPRCSRHPIGTLRAAFAAFWAECPFTVDAIVVLPDHLPAVPHSLREYGLRLLNLHLSGGAGGFEHMLAHLGPPTEAMWRDLGRVELTPEVSALVGRAVAERIGGLDLPAVVAERDAVLVGLLRAKAGTGLP